MGFKATDQRTYSVMAGGAEMSANSDEPFEQLSPLMDDVQMAFEIVKAMVPAQSPFDAGKVFIEAHGELLQLTFDYVEQCGSIVEAAIRRMSAEQVRQ